MPVEIKGLEKLNAKLRDMAAKAQKEGDPIVAVGYTAAYALFVHENMEIWPPGMRLRGLPRGMGFRRSQATGIVTVPTDIFYGGKVGGKNRGFYWDPQGKAGPKFLEGPLREFKQELANIVVVALSRGKSMSQALLLAGLRLQRESQQRVPVDTGNLKASAFTRLEFGSADLEGALGTAPGDGVGMETIS